MIQCSQKDIHYFHPHMSFAYQYWRARMEDRKIFITKAFTLPMLYHIPPAWLRTNRASLVHDAARLHSLSRRSWTKPSGTTYSGPVANIMPFPHASGHVPGTQGPAGPLWQPHSEPEGEVSVQRESPAGSGTGWSDRHTPWDGFQNTDIPEPQLMTPSSPSPHCRPLSASDFPSPETLQVTKEQLELWIFLSFRKCYRESPLKRPIIQELYAKM